jgi:CubicO group peptidase (beta-lactamase class C family)
MEGVTVAQVLGHSAGLPAVRELLPAGTLYDWDAFCAALAAEASWWKPGTQHGYHVITFGFLAGEVLRRVSGRNVRVLVREEIAAPPGINLSLGLPEEADGRAADLLPPEPAPVSENHPMLLAMRGPASMTALAFTNPRDLVERGVAHSTRWRRAIVPAANAHANALALAPM